MSKNQQRFRYFSLWSQVILWWGLCAMMFMTCLRYFSSDKRDDPVVDHAPTGAVAKNELKGFEFVRTDGEHNHRPVMRIAFDRLSVENGMVGVFRTAIHKSVTIENFQTRYYTYSTGPSSTSTVTEDMKQWLEPAAAKIGHGKNITRLQNGLVSNTEFASTLPDVSNTTHITIKGFDYQCFSDGQLCLTVHSLRAKFSVKSVDTILLRGHVVLSDTQGTTLQANTVRWDIKKQQFTVHGTYLLNRNGERTAGTGLCLDEHLDSVIPAVARQTHWRR